MRLHFPGFFFFLPAWTDGWPTHPYSRHYSCVCRQQSTPLAGFSVYDLAHGVGFDLHFGCATCCSWPEAAVFHQRKIRSTLWLWQLRRPSAAVLPFARTGLESWLDPRSCQLEREWTREKGRWQERICLTCCITASPIFLNKPCEQRDVLENIKDNKL